MPIRPQHIARRLGASLRPTQNTTTYHRHHTHRSLTTTAKPARPYPLTFFLSPSLLVSILPISTSVFTVLCLWLKIYARVFTARAVMSFVNQRIMKRESLDEICDYWEEEWGSRPRVYRNLEGWLEEERGRGWWERMVWDSPLPRAY